MSAFAEHRRRFGPIRGLWCAETPNHVHPCPTCYQRKPCPYPDCTIVHDLCEPGKPPSGSHARCEDCVRAGAPEGNGPWP